MTILFLNQELKVKKIKNKFCGYSFSLDSRTYYHHSTILSVKKLISDFDFQDYCSRYLDLRPSSKQGEVKNINDDIVFEVELIKQIEVILIILMLVKEVSRYPLQGSRDYPCDSKGYGCIS